MVFKCFTPTIRVRIPLSIQFENDQKRYLMLVSGLTLRSVWPDISKAWQKSSHISFYLKITQKVIKYLGYFCKRNCHQHLSKSLNLVTLLTFQVMVFAKKIFLFMVDIFPAKFRFRFCLQIFAKIWLTVNWKKWNVTINCFETESLRKWGCSQLQFLFAIAFLLLTHTICLCDFANDFILK